MKKRPLSVTIIGWLLTAVGVFGFAYHFHEAGVHNAFRGENVWILALEIAALASGVFILRGNNWARWLALAWMGFHVAVSFLDSWQKVAVHAIFFVLIAYCLFHAGAREYFRRSETV